MQKADMIASLITMQLFIASHLTPDSKSPLTGYKNVDEVSDRFGIGYVFGFADVIGNAKPSQDVTAEDLQIITFVFLDIFGVESGAIYFREALNFQASRLVPDFQQGRRTGAKDAHDYRRTGGDHPPFGWADYLAKRDSTDALHELVAAWRAKAEFEEETGFRDWDEGYNSGLRRAAKDLEALLAPAADRPVAGRDERRGKTGA